MCQVKKKLLAACHRLAETARAISERANYAAMREEADARAEEEALVRAACAADEKERACREAKETKVIELLDEGEAKAQRRHDLAEGRVKSAEQRKTRQRYRLQRAAEQPDDHGEGALGEHDEQRQS